MRRLNWLLLAVLLIFGCAKVVAVDQIPPVTLGEPTFFPTIEAHTDAPIMAGNRVDVLLNGDETFPVMLRDIKSARQTITFAQYLYEDGALARQFAEAFAERCRAGIKADILLDDHGLGQISGEIIALMRDAGCRVEFFRRVEAPAIIFPWKLRDYNYRSPPAHPGDRRTDRLYRRLWHRRFVDRRRTHGGALARYQRAHRRSGLRIEPRIESHDVRCAAGAIWKRFFKQT
jgi:hypothetical protein